MTLSWDDVRLCLEIERSGSMTAAARTLRLSQPTLGRRLKELEGSLGARLFERLPNQLVVTSFGATVLQSARDMERAAIDIRRVAELRSASSSAVAVSCTLSIGQFLSEHLAQLDHHIADQRITVSISTTRATVDLARREADIALRMRAPPVQGKLRSRRLGRVAFTLYADAAIDATNLSRVPFIGLTPDRPPPQGPWLDGFVAQSGGKIVHRLGEAFMRHQAVRRGLGVSLLPCFFGDRDDALVRVLEPPPDLTEDLYMLVHEDVAQSPPTAHVADALRRLIASNASLLAGERPSRCGGVAPSNIHR